MPRNVSGFGRLPFSGGEANHKEAQGEMRMLRINRRAFSVGLAAAAAGMARDAGAAEGEVTVVGFGGSFQDAMREVYWKPFEAASGIKVLEDTWNGAFGTIRAKAGSGAVNWDVIQMPGDGLLLGEEEGLYAPIDWQALGGREAYIEQGATDYGVGAEVGCIVLGYDSSKLPAGPESWKDAYDLGKFPGKRSFYKGPKYNLETALYADGVASADIYKVLKTPEGVDRAFAKLDTVKKEIIWWESGALPVQLLASGEVAMCSAYGGRIFSAIKEGKNFKIVWPGSLIEVDSWVILKDAPNKAAALKLIQWMGDAGRQVEIAKRMGYGPTVRAAMAKVPAEIAPSLPSSPENLAVTIDIDATFWMENEATLTERFTSWVNA